MVEAYLISLGTTIGIYLILTLSLQLSIGFTGMLNLGHIAFFGIGAYISALLAISGVPIPLAMLLGGSGAAILGFLLALPLNRLRGDYLALATLAFAFIVQNLLNNLVFLTRGPRGIPGIPKPEFLSFLPPNESFLALTFVVVILTYLLLRKTTISPFGRVLQAIRDDERAAKTLGKDTKKVKAYALAISSFFAGIAGALFAHQLTFIDPTSFTVLEIIPVLTIVVIGGLASLEGTAAATVLIMLLPELLRFVGLPSEILGPIRQLLFSFLLLVILWKHPRGIAGKVDL